MLPSPVPHRDGFAQLADFYRRMESPPPLAGCQASDLPYSPRGLRVLGEEGHMYDRRLDPRHLKAVLQ